MRVVLGVGFWDGAGLLRVLLFNKSGNTARGLGVRIAWIERLGSFVARVYAA